MKIDIYVLSYFRTFVRKYVVVVRTEVQRSSMIDSQIRKYESTKVMILPEIDINRVLLCPTTTRTAINNICDTLLDTTYCMYLALYVRKYLRRQSCTVCRYVIKYCTTVRKYFRTFVESTKVEYFWKYKYVYVYVQLYESTRTESSTTLYTYTYLVLLSKVRTKISFFTFVLESTTFVVLSKVVRKYFRTVPSCIQRT